MSAIGTSPELHRNTAREQSPGTGFEVIEVFTAPKPQERTAPKPEVTAMPNVLSRLAELKAQNGKPGIESLTQPDALDRMPGTSLTIQRDSIGTSAIHVSGNNSERAIGLLSVIRSPWTALRSPDANAARGIAAARITKASAAVKG